jgi:hypothetical protein
VGLPTGFAESQIWYSQCGPLCVDCKWAPPPRLPRARSEALDKQAPCSFGLSATNQQYFSLRTNQPSPTSQQYFSLRTNQHQPSATSRTNRLKPFAESPRSSPWQTLWGRATCGCLMESWGPHARPMRLSCEALPRYVVTLLSAKIVFAMSQHLTN